jgi:BolA protein
LAGDDALAGQVADSIADKLRRSLAPTRLEIVDDSARHEGHAGARPGGETHFRVEIVSDAFAGKTRVDRHRLVNAALADELAGRVHALQVKALTPDEDSGRA